MEKQRSFGEKQDEQLGDLIGSSKEQHIAQQLKNHQDLQKKVALRDSTAICSAF